jgi:5-methylcytosine-specific restriction endonuclease McrA
MLWMRSRERAAALKAANYCCADCGAKQSKAVGKEVSLEVHHLDGIQWDNIIRYIYRHVLPDPSRLQVLCKECHSKETAKQRETLAEKNESSVLHDSTTLPVANKIKKKKVSKKN